MKTLWLISILSFSVGAVAQTAGSSSDNNGSSSSAVTTATGNSQSVSLSASPSMSTSNVQSIVFSGPSETTSNVNSTVNSTSYGTQNINTNATGTTTQNINTSGTSRGIVEYTGSYTLKNVPSVAGPNLTTSNDTCMGSSSGSANGTGFGISFGTTWTDEHCKRLKMSRELWNKGMKAASLAMDCMDEAARMALEMTGTKCPQSMTVEERRIAFGPQASAVGAAPSPAATTAMVVSPPPPLPEMRARTAVVDMQPSAQYSK